MTTDAQNGAEQGAAAASRAAAVAARPLKRSFSIAGHRTSISLEGAFWDALREAARHEGVPLAELVRRIDGTRGEAGLSGAVRVWLLAYARRGGLAFERKTDSVDARNDPNLGAETTDPVVHRGEGVLPPKRPA